MINALTRRAIALAALLLAAACTGASPPPPPSPAASSSVDAAACGAAGGVVRPVCRMQRPMCVIPNADAGKACTDDSQCGGGCVYDGAPMGADGTTTGVCRKDNDPCGCIEHVKSGKKAGGICVD
jgi:hypothetical protein